MTETTPCKPINAYGESKLMIETVLKKHAKQNPNFRYASFRFFNVAGNDLGNRVQDIHWRRKQNLVPKIVNIVIRQKGTLKVLAQIFRPQMVRAFVTTSTHLILQQLC